MVENELKEQVNTLIEVIDIIVDRYKKLELENTETIDSKLNFYQIYREADEKAERYGGLLATIYDTIHARVEDDVDYYDVIHTLIDDWYESEITK